MMNPINVLDKKSEANERNSRNEIASVAGYALKVQQENIILKT
jgi:hypothetical protein